MSNDTTDHVLFQANTEISLQWNYVCQNDYSHSHSTAAHIHPYYEMYVYLEGDVSFFVNDRIYSLTKGDIVITKPNTVHHAIVHKDCLHKHYCVFFYSVDSTVSEVLRDLSDEAVLHLDTPQRDRLTEMMSSLTKTLADRSCNMFLRLAELYRLLALLSGSAKQRTQSSTPPQLMEILRYIGTEYPEIHSISQIYQNFFISPSSLERLFRQYIKMTPYQYLTSVKMASACRMLSDGKSVTDAAMQSGFPDSSHFALLFKNRFGMTPSQFRKRFSDKIGQYDRNAG